MYTQSLKLHGKNQQILPKPLSVVVLFNDPLIEGFLGFLRKRLAWNSVPAWIVIWIFPFHMEHFLRPLCVQSWEEIWSIMKPWVEWTSGKSQGGIKMAHIFEAPWQLVKMWNLVWTVMLRRYAYIRVYLISNDQDTCNPHHSYSKGRICSWMHPKAPEQRLLCSDSYRPLKLPCRTNHGAWDTVSRNNFASFLKLLAQTYQGCVLMMAECCVHHTDHVLTLK